MEGAAGEWSRVVRELTGEMAVNRVVATGGSDTLEESIKSIMPNGEIALVTAIGKRPMIEIHPPVLAASILTIRRFLVGNRSAFEAMNRTIAQSRLHPVIDRVFAFSEVKDDLIFAEKMSSLPKIVFSRTLEKVV